MHSWMLVPLPFLKLLSFHHLLCWRASDSHWHLSIDSLLYIMCAVLHRYILGKQLLHSSSNIHFWFSLVNSHTCPQTFGRIGWRLCNSWLMDQWLFQETKRPLFTKLRYSLVNLEQLKSYYERDRKNSSVSLSRQWNCASPSAYGSLRLLVNFGTLKSWRLT